MQTIIDAGVNPNVKERCGATPVTLAVIKRDEEMIRLLLTNFAIWDNSFFTSVPGPKQIADKLGLDTISALIDDCLSRDSQQDISVWEAINSSARDISVGDGNTEPRTMTNTLFVASFPLSSFPIEMSLMYSTFSHLHVIVVFVVHRIWCDTTILWRWNTTI